MPVVTPRYLPFLLLFALLIFIEYRLAYSLFYVNQDDLTLSIRRDLVSLFHDARDRWLYSGAFVVISIALLQYSRFIGRLIPQEVEDVSGELASFLEAAIVSTLAVVVSALIKLLLLVASWPVRGAG